MNFYFIKGLLLSFFILLSTDVNCQIPAEKEKYNLVAEKYYANLVTDVVLTLNKKSFKVSEAAQYQDTLIQHFLNIPQSSDATVDYDLTPFSSQFIRVMSRINNFKIPNNDSLLKGADSLINEINRLKSFKEKIYMLYHFAYHFRPYGDEISEKYSEKANKSIVLDANNWNDEVVSNIAQANYSKSQDLPAALAIYEAAYSYYVDVDKKNEIADLENNIANLYALRDQYEYKVKYIKHLNLAGNIYILLKDTLNVSIARKKIVEATVEILDSSRSAQPEELIMKDYRIIHLGMLNKNMETRDIIDSFFKDKQDSYKYEIFKQIDFLAKDADNGRKLDSWTYSVLGDYFLKIKKYDVALSYYNGALFKIKYFDDLYNSLIKLSFFYSIRNDYLNSLRFIDGAIKIACKQKEFPILNNLYIRKATILCTFKKYQDAINNFKYGAYLCDSINMDQVPKSNELIKAYNGLANAYSLLNIKDSAAFYKEKYNNLQLKLIDELDRLNNLEYGYDFERKNNVLLEKEKKISWANTVIGGLAGLITIFLIAFWVTVSVKNKKVRKVRLDLNALAKGKLHNIQNNYSSIYNLIRKKDFTRAQNYAEASSNFFRLIVDKEDLKDNKWTLENEMEILEAFYLREQVLGKKIRLIPPKFDTINIKEVVFLPEVFTTLFHNSIRHGITDPNKELTLKIEVQKIRKTLFFTVSDNGTPSEAGSYIKENKPYKGLCMLKNRILNEFTSGFRMFKLKNIFVIEPIKNVGTTIKFKFPYATIKNINP